MDRDWPQGEGMLGDLSGSVFTQRGARAARPPPAPSCAVQVLKRVDERLQRYQTAVDRIADIFRDRQRTQFTCVCIAEHLSVYETLRLTNELLAASINCEASSDDENTPHSQQSALRWRAPIPLERALMLPASAWQSMVGYGTQRIQRRVQGATLAETAPTTWFDSRVL